MAETLVEEVDKALEWEGMAAHRNKTSRDSEELLSAVEVLGAVEGGAGHRLHPTRVIQRSQH